MMQFFLILMTQLTLGRSIAEPISPKCLNPLLQTIEEREKSLPGKKPIPSECQLYKVEDMDKEMLKRVAGIQAKKGKKIIMDQKLSSLMGELLTIDDEDLSAYCEKLKYTNYQLLLSQIQTVKDMKECKELSYTTLDEGGFSKYCPSFSKEEIIAYEKACDKHLSRIRKN